MLRIQQITNDSLQKQALALDDGSLVNITMYYIPLQIGWFIRELSYGDFITHNIRITNSPNILYQFRNQLPFGLACSTDSNREPTQQQDFSTGAAKLFLLEQSEVTEYTEFLSGQT